MPPEAQRQENAKRSPMFPRFSLFSCKPDGGSRSLPKVPINAKP
jgi:hypothetical protein